ncbi:MAG: NAD(P)H-hydrate dehydratase [Erysipelotrichaceae bacterium]|nr:NAD(P)H-hydrate dehydratase [Erysipelotrichaceae bacterium]
MKAVSDYQMLQCEKNDINQRRFTEQGYVLSVAMTLENHILRSNPEEVTIICGPLRNGHYGMALASLLRNDTGIKVNVGGIADKNDPYLKELAERGIHFEDNSRILKSMIEDSSYIVDCIFGIELDEKIDYPYLYLVEWINNSRAFVLSVDIPSGIDGTDGTIYGSCVNANETLTLQLPKIGLYMYPASEHVGDIFIEPVGLSYDSINSIDSKVFVNDYREIQAMLPHRLAHSHKGTYGKVLLIAGSPMMTGAAALCARATLKSGAGLLTVMSYPEVLSVITNTLFEAKTIAYDDASVHKALQETDFKEFDLIVIGPGLGRSKTAETLVYALMQSDRDVLVDADGLYFLKDNLDLLKRKATTIITPHLGEYQRMFEYHQETVIPDLQKITREYGSLIVVLKSERTLIAGKGEVTINTTGNNALAKGGSGDVLAGIIAGLFAQRETIQSVIAAVYVHSLAADYWLQSHSSYSLLASELIEMADGVLYEMTEKGA